MALNHLSARHFRADHFKAVGCLIETQPPVIAPNYGVTNQASAGYYRWPKREEELKLKPIRINPIIGLSSFNGSLLLKSVLSSTIVGKSLIIGDLSVLVTASVDSVIDGAELTGQLRLRDLAELSDDELLAIVSVIRGRKRKCVG